MDKDRNVLFDIAKGIGIVLIVAGHARIPILTFLSLFHVPLFFIISGYFIKDCYFENTNNIFIYIKKRLKTLWVPFFLFNTVFVLLNNLFIRINIYTTNPEFLTGSIGNTYGLNELLSLKAILSKICYFFLFAYQTPLGGATWFFRVLFWASVFYIVLSSVLKKLIKTEFVFNILRGIFCFIVLLSGFYMATVDLRFYGIGITCSMLICLFLGVIYRKFENNIKINIWTGLLSLLVLIMVLKYNPSGFCISANKYQNPLLLILSSVSGFWLVLYISKIFLKSDVFTKIFFYLGQHTVSILCLHLLCFKLITFLIVYLYNLPDYRLASFPVYNINNYWWIVYVIAGCILPVLFSFLYKKLVAKIIRK